MPDINTDEILNDVSQQMSDVANHAAREAGLTAHRICGALPPHLRALAFGAAAAIIRHQFDVLMAETPPEGVPDGPQHTLMAEAYRNSLKALESGEGVVHVGSD